MKKGNRKFGLLAGILLLTAVVAVIHLQTRTEVPEGSLRLVVEGRETMLALSKLELAPVTGTIVNGKGEEKQIDARGIAVSALLSQNGVDAPTQVKVIADDEYYALLTAEDVFSPEGVYLIEEEDGGVQLIVFGDTNSKRNVSNVVTVEVS